MTTVSRCARAEGIPNIKVFNLAAEPMPLMTGDTIPAMHLAPDLDHLITSAGAQKDTANFFLAPRMQSEL